VSGWGRALYAVCCASTERSGGAIHFPLSVMTARRRLKRLGRRLASCFYPSALWLQNQKPDPNRRQNWYRYSRHEIPGPAFDVILILICGLLALACLFV